MTKRERLENKIKKNNAKIEELQKTNESIRIEGYLLCDKQQQYKEEIRFFGRGKTKKEVLVGSIHWKEWFFDSDYPNDKTKGVEVNRRATVRQNGEWI